eukprot:9341860-Heterocapsa_arctica.AAC.1
MLRSDTSSHIVQAKAAQYLRDRAAQLNSHVLSALAVRVSADPFVKVKKMIKDLIVRLMEEAKEKVERKRTSEDE